MNSIYFYQNLPSTILQRKSLVAGTTCLPCTCAFLSHSASQPRGTGTPNDCPAFLGAAALPDSMPHAAWIGLPKQARAVAGRATR